ncbi:unnamed protein product [Rhizoctonia solani]|uniref:Amine oxidase domain-containing protein n=1 Tax=Rhizoctonia solani TaxID=456999 RepID=A0A8H2WGF5_9AGAM|nr:unnamed protein product [Rhizoctonia solani]
MQSIKPTIIPGRAVGLPGKSTVQPGGSVKQDPYEAAKKISNELYRLYEDRLKFGNPIIVPGRSIPSIPNDQRVENELPKITTPVKRIAIIGAGVAGLYAAMLLKQKDREFEVDIYEASDRIGGRLYTHRFNNKSIIGTPAPGGRYDYFDVGAMRFPNTPIMEKTFKLFETLELNGHLLDYHISNETNWLVYNGRRITRHDLAENPHIWAQDPFGVSVSNGGTVPDEYAKQDPVKILREVLQPLITKVVQDPDKGLDDLIDNYDHYSTRSYLASKSFPPAVISWIETATVGTGWFDRALIETVLEEIAFSYNQTSTAALSWKCVDGGSEMIPIRMVEWLQRNAKKTKIHLRHRVTMVEYMNKELIVSGVSHPLLTGDSSFFRETYSHVVFAIPPPCLRMINLDTCELDYAQRNAMRQLQLAPSIKIGMKFKKAWWLGAGQVNVGGQSTTDRTARTIVYPSHGRQDELSTVLIVSYAWTSDALVLGAMMHGPGSAEEERLKQIMLGDLAYVHQGGRSSEDEEITLQFLINQFEYMYPFDWQHNPLAMGAFGLFGPSQFQEFYRHVTRPAARGQIYFIGETFSTTHGWVAGALDSAERGVLQLLQHHQTATGNQGRPENLVDKFLEGRDVELGKILTYIQLVVSLVYEHEEFDKN